MPAPTNRPYENVSGRASTALSIRQSSGFGISMVEPLPVVDVNEHPILRAGVVLRCLDRCKDQRRDAKIETMSKRRHGVVSPQSTINHRIVPSTTCDA